VAASDQRASLVFSLDISLLTTKNEQHEKKLISRTLRAIRSFRETFVTASCRYTVKLSKNGQKKSGSMQRQASATSL
jgi:hypothetical protein